MKRHALVVLFSLKWELEHCQHLINGVEKHLTQRCWMKKAAHMKRSISFVVVTHLSETDLVDRLKPLVDRLGATECFWVFEAPKFAKSSDAGNFDPFRSALIEAQEEIRHPRHPQHMKEAQGFRQHGGSVENRHGRTIR